LVKFKSGFGKKKEASRYLRRNWDARTTKVMKIMKEEEKNARQ